jgi:hypothetical protein
MSPEQAVQHQLDAYNARDIERFLQAYAQDIEIFRPPLAEPVLRGIEALRAHYASKRFNLPQLHAELVNRMVLGKTVIDHERVRGVEAQPMDVAAVYEVTDGVIRRAWFHSG